MDGSGRSSCCCWPLARPSWTMALPLKFSILKTRPLSRFFIIDFPMSRDMFSSWRCFLSLRLSNINMYGHLSTKTPQQCQVRRLKKAAEVLFFCCIFDYFCLPKVTPLRRLGQCFGGINTRQNKCRFFFWILLFQPQCFYSCTNLEKGWKWMKMVDAESSFVTKKKHLPRILQFLLQTVGVRLPKKRFHWQRSLQRNKARHWGQTLTGCPWACLLKSYEKILGSASVNALLQVLQ